MVNYTPHAFMCVMRDYSSTELIVVLCDVSFTFWLYCAELPSRSVGHCLFFFIHFGLRFGYGPYTSGELTCLGKTDEKVFSMP